MADFKKGDKAEWVLAGWLLAASAAWGLGEIGSNTG